MSDWRVFDMRRTGGYRADNYFAGVYTNPNLDRRAPFGLELRTVPPQLFLHPQRRIERALGMVLVRDRRAEQREDSVAGRLHDVPVVAAGRVDHQLERRIDDGARLF